MSLKSDAAKTCAGCGHSQYVHVGGQRGKENGACNAYTCKRDKKCGAFKLAECPMKGRMCQCSSLAVCIHQK